MTGAPKRRPEESYLHNTSEVSFLPPEVAGSIARVPAPEIETSCAMGSAGTLQLMGDGEPATATADRDLIERHVARVIVKPQALDVCLICCVVRETGGDPVPCSDSVRARRRTSADTEHFRRRDRACIFGGRRW